MIVGSWKVVMIAAARRSVERSAGCGETAGDSSHRFDLNQLVTIVKGDKDQRCARRVMLPNAARAARRQARGATQGGWGSFELSGSHGLASWPAAYWGIS